MFYENMGMTYEVSAPVTKLKKWIASSCGWRKNYYEKIF